jgi:hypothetical protein
MLRTRLCQNDYITLLSFLLLSLSLSLPHYLSIIQSNLYTIFSSHSFPLSLSHSPSILKHLYTISLSPSPSPFSSFFCPLSLRNTNKRIHNLSLSPSLSLYPSLSLSRTHTHADIPNILLLLLLRHITLSLRHRHFQV